jgi:1-aminocyclopropane-1-carboxylate deaminase
MFQNNIISENKPILLRELSDFPVSLALKREDLLHPQVSGNKFRKLKYNIAEAKAMGCSSLLTFGGAFSNHILATAVAGKLAGLQTIGVIRGEELIDNYKGNSTLEFAQACGMTFEFVTREHYKLKGNEIYLAELSKKYPNSYVLPEGGTNNLAIKGCAEIITAEDSKYDYLCVAVGTGGTLAGLVLGSNQNQNLVGYSALKGTFQKKEVEKYASKTNYTITDSYCFGGYAKIDSSLIRFMNNFKEQTGILLDPIYTGKLLYGIVEDIKSGRYPKNSRILAIHTGGLQGIQPMNKLLQKKNLPQIEI